MSLIIAYEINSSSGHVVVDRILDIRHIAYDEKGSYALPTKLKERRFVGQIGVVPNGERASVFLQPRGVYIPDFGYGPITGRITVHKTLEELRGDYDKFPTLQRYREVFVRKILEEDMPYVEREVFDTINSHLGSCAQVTEDIDDLMNDSKFCKALRSVFESAGFETFANSRMARATCP